jgi:HEAT repeat protein
MTVLIRVVFGLFCVCVSEADMESCEEQGKTNPVRKQKPLDMLIKDLQSEDSEVRFYAALEIRGRGPEAKAAVPYLIKLLRDERIGVRGMAIDALGHIEDSAKDAVPHLIKILEQGKRDFPKRKTHKDPPNTTTLIPAFIP